MSRSISCALDETADEFDEVCPTIFFLIQQNKTNIRQSKIKRYELPFPSITSDMAREVGRGGFWIPLERFLCLSPVATFYTKFRDKRCFFHEITSNNHS